MHHVVELYLLPEVNLFDDFRSLEVVDDKVILLSQGEDQVLGDDELND